MHKFTSNIPAIFNDTCTMLDASAQNMDLSGNLDVSGNSTIGGDLGVVGMTLLTGALSVTESTSLVGNVGIGSVSGT